MKQFNLKETLAEAKWTEDDIAYIYRGGNYVCRCGCAGKYFHRGERGFTRALNELRRGFLTEEAGDKVHVTGYGHDEDMTSEGIDIEPDSYINVPIATDPRHNKCFCIYRFQKV